MSRCVSRIDSLIWSVCADPLPWWHQRFDLQRVATTAVTAAALAARTRHARQGTKAEQADTAAGGRREGSGGGRANRHRHGRSGHYRTRG